MNGKSYVLGPYLITYDDSLLVEEYHTPWYDGLIFTIEEGVFDLVNNYAMGTRLIIKDQNGHRDIPLKPSSFACLPKGVQATEIEKD